MELNKIQFNLSPKALDCWKPGLRIAAQSDENTINIFDTIGEDYWTGECVTAKSISKSLASMKGKDITVNINSPGGSMFEGLAIYNLLREHDGKITVKVLGIAASAASIIASGVVNPSGPGTNFSFAIGTKLGNSLFNFESLSIITTLLG